MLLSCFSWPVLLREGHLHPYVMSIQRVAPISQWHPCFSMLLSAFLCQP